MTLEEKKARIRELLHIIEWEGDGELYFKTPSLVLGHRSPQALMDSNYEEFIDFMLGLLEQGLDVLRDEIASGRMIPMSTMN